MDTVNAYINGRIGNHFATNLKGQIPIWIYNYSWTPYYALSIYFCFNVTQFWLSSFIINFNIW